MYYHRIYFTESIESSKREALEKLFYFNPNQHLYIKNIEKTVEDTGHIRILEESGKLLLRSSNAKNEKSLFVLDAQHENSELIGVALYHPEIEQIVISHIAIDPICSCKGDLSNQIITIRIIERLRIEALKLGFEKIKLPYRNIYLNTKYRLTSIIE